MNIGKAMRLAKSHTRTFSGKQQQRGCTECPHAQHVGQPYCTGYIASGFSPDGTVRLVPCGCREL